MSASMPTAPASPPPIKPNRFVKWNKRILGFCLAVFALDLGLFLLVFPWLSNWDLSWIPVHFPRLLPVWMSRYFRGAMSGLGLLNVYIGLAELFKQLRSIFGDGQ